MQTTFEVHEVGEWQVLRVIGEIDMASAPQLRQRVVGLVVGGCRNLVLDLSDVDFCDSTGIGVLVGAVRRIRTAGGDIRLVSSQPHLLQMLEITRLDRVFDRYDTLDEAVSLPAINTGSPE